MLSGLSLTKGVKGDPRGLQCMSIFPSPHPLSSRKLKKALKLPTHRYLPTPNISFSPSSLHFRPDFSLLPTFSGHFSLLPIVYLPHHRVQTTISELTENSYWPIIENTRVVQLLISFRNKSSAASNSTFISFGSSVLFFSRNWRAASRVFLMLNRSDSLAFVVRWTSTSGIKIWITCWSVFQLHTVSWILFASKILAWICCL